MKKTAPKANDSQAGAKHHAGKPPSSTADPSAGRGAAPRKITAGQLKLFLAYQKFLEKEHGREKKKRDRDSKKSPGTPPKPLILDFDGCGPDTDFEEYIHAAQRVLHRLEKAAKDIGLDL